MANNAVSNTGPILHLTEISFMSRTLKPHSLECGVREHPKVPHKPRLLSRGVLKDFLIKALKIFSFVLIPEEVSNELRKHGIKIPRSVKIKSLDSKSKDRVKVLTNQYSIDSGEAEAIALALQEKASYFLTDDLEARQVAKNYNLEVHGTVGIVLRAFRHKLINKKEAIEKVRSLKNTSSLFITQDLISNIIEAIEDFS